MALTRDNSQGHRWHRTPPCHCRTQHLIYSIRPQYAEHDWNLGMIHSIFRNVAKTPDITRLDMFYSIWLMTTTTLNWSEWRFIILGYLVHRTVSPQELWVQGTSGTCNGVRDISDFKHFSWDKKKMIRHTPWKDLEKVPNTSRAAWRL